MTVKFGLSEDEFLFIGVPVSLEIVTLCNAGAIAVIIFLRTVLPSLIKDTAPYLSYSDDSEGGFQFALNKLFEFLDAKEDSEVDNQGAQEKKEEQKKDNDDAVGEDEPAGTDERQKNKEVDKDTKEENPKETTLLNELSAILKALQNLIILALQVIRGLPTIAHVILVSTLTSLLIFTVGCASVSLPRWSKGLPPMAVLYGLIICKFKEEIHHCITVLPTENTVLLLLLSTVGFLVVGWRVVATICLLVLLAIAPPLLVSTVLTAKVRLPDGWHKYLLVLVVMLVQMFIASMKNWILTILGFVVFRGFIASKVLSDQSQRLLIVVVAVFLTACFYYRGLVFMVERLPAPQGRCIGGGRPTPILKKSSCTNLDFASTRFFKSAINVNETSNLVGTYRDNHYTVIGLTSLSDLKKKEVPEMNFTGVVAFNNRSNDVAIVIHDIFLKSGLTVNYYNFYKYYHKAVRDEHHNLVHYIFGMLKANVSSVTVVARAEHGIMAKIIAEDINEQIELFEYYETDSCVQTQLICKKARTESSRVCSSSGNLLVNESIAEFERSILNKQLLAPKKTSLIKSTTKNGFYIRQSSQKWSSSNDRPVEEVTRHIVYGEIAVFVDDTIENSVSVAYRENLFTCKQTFEAIVESFFPGYEYWHELRGFAEKDGNPVHGIVLFHVRRGEVLIALRSALEEELLLGDSGLYDLEKWNATSDDGRVSQKLFQVYTRTGIQLQYPQRSLRSSCRAVLDEISKEHPHQNITVAVTGHSSGAAMAVVVALDLADKVARDKSYASINAVKVVSFALPPVVGNAAMTKKLQELNVSHIHYYHGEDNLVVKSTAKYGFDAEMNQVARPLTMNLEAKRPVCNPFTPPLYLSIRLFPVTTVQQ